MEVCRRRRLNPLRQSLRDSADVFTWKARAFTRIARVVTCKSVGFVLLAIGLQLSVGSSCSVAQSFSQGVPATKMVPIGPPIGRGPVPSVAAPSTSSAPVGTFNSQGFGGSGFGSSGFGGSGFGAAPPPPNGFDPYASTPQGGNSFGGTGFSSPGFSTPSVTPPSFGGTSPPGTSVTPIGPPVPVPGPNAPSANFNTVPNSVPNFGPRFGGTANGGGLFGGLFSRPASSPVLNGPILSSPAYPGGYDNPNVYGAPSVQSSSAFPSNSFPSNSFPSNPFPGSALPSSSPSTLFPGGIFSGGLFRSDPYGQASAYRLLQGPRLRHSYIGFGDSPDDVNINDTDASVIFAFPNFLYSSQPLYVVPSFSLHLWDGPNLPGAVGAGGADLPGSAYSGFIDFGWNSDPNQMFSTEFGVRVGAFTDFETFNSDSIRILGKGLASFRLTPATTLKAGVYYLDRNKVKLLPAGGLLYQPNPYTRMDLFFPEPKLARYWRTIGTRDVWWYLSGDYGGGSWTIERDDGSNDSIDINDIRVMLGFEWGASDAIRAGRRTGFFEVGYVFDREVEYRRNPNDDFTPDDGIMFRLGIGY